CPTDPSTSSPSPPMGALRAPGPAAPVPLVDVNGGMKWDPYSVSSNPCTHNSGAVVITELQGADPTLLNVWVNGNLYQLIEDSSITQSDFSAGNMFIKNQIDLSTSNDDGLILNYSQRTYVSQNTITDAFASIRAGGATAQRQFPGQCYSWLPFNWPLNRNRFTPTGLLCLQNFDCQPFGSDGDIWSCFLHPPTLTKWNTANDTITSNMINAAPSAVFGIVTQGDTMCIANNRLSQNTMVGMGTGTGIALLGPVPLAPTTRATIMSSTVDHFQVALGLVE